MSRAEDFNTATKRAAAERSQGVCECARMTEDIRGSFPLECDRVAAEFDHIEAIVLGGKGTLKNCAHLCTPCHKIKTALDKAAMAKRHRHEVRKDRPKPRKQPARMIRNRGFNTQFIRGFDGSVRDRT